MITARSDGANIGGGMLLLVGPFIVVVPLLHYAMVRAQRAPTAPASAVASRR